MWPNYHKDNDFVELTEGFGHGQIDFKLWLNRPAPLWSCSNLIMLTTFTLFKFQTVSVQQQKKKKKKKAASAFNPGFSLFKQVCNGFCDL